jgi:two-component system phosphate regulon sensor histidine kinase PhoR
MSRNKLLWQIYPYYLIIIIAPLVSVAIYTSNLMREVYREETGKRLEAIARLVAEEMPTQFSSQQRDVIDRICKTSGMNSHSRLTVVAASGEVLGDTDRDPGKLENHRSRPEIAEAMTGRVALVSRFSNTFQQSMIYAAVPVQREGQIVAVVRCAIPTKEISAEQSGFNKRIVLTGVIITALATLVSLLVFRKLRRPLEALKEGAERFARGELTVKVAVPDNEEIGALAESMNLMAEQLNERISTIVKQKNEQQALLSSMVEGVLAVDANERIMSINLAAAKFFNLDPAQAVKRSVYETIRHADFLEFVSQTLLSSKNFEREIYIQGEGDKILQAHGSVMQDAAGNRVGAVIVLNDVTRLKRLENIRRDFVANVSHELKTPITSIRGFVETLIDGAINNPEEATRFLNIIVKQADRLNSIVDDLLTLSRIEKESETAEMELIRQELWGVMLSAVQSCEPAANSKEIKIEIDGDRSLAARINKRQFEQALINLIDNAIKYSGRNSSLSVNAVSINGEIKISVSDQGSGIEKKHLGRIFERFYRVDKARSREAGGTGLGLSIVKHIVLAHKGRVDVDSTPGKGSTFTIYLPSNGN